jgi:hypothetical protein
LASRLTSPVASASRIWAVVCGIWLSNPASSPPLPVFTSYPKALSPCVVGLETILPYVIGGNRPRSRSDHTPALVAIALTHAVDQRT